MFINPNLAIEKGWIKGIKDPAKQVQPNAIDFTLDRVMWIDRQSPARITEQGKSMRASGELHVSDLGMWNLTGESVFDGTSDVYVEVPEGVAAILYTRSTFARNGVFIMSGLYDSGYKGPIGFTIYTPGGDIQVAPGTRIGQIAFIHSESAGMYAGGYNHDKGTHYAEKNTGASSLKPVPQVQPTLMEPPIAGSVSKSEAARALESTGTFDSQQSGKPAGIKTFI
jgi:deoxycytidine triphosphate deaminase